jgi:multiple sugar transport system ATP-binding protein
MDPRTESAALHRAGDDVPSRSTATAAELFVDDLSANYGSEPVLRRLTCHAAPGTILSLLGPSGCGKSTLLRVVAGLLAPSAGDVRIDGRSVLGLKPGERGVAMVFQNYALYPHLTVRRNLSLALEAQRIAGEEIGRRIDAAAALLGIGELLARKPPSLSGGQQQRVALGRALVRQPRLYLLDEPLSNLDALLREQMRSELKALFQRIGATVLYVTHDQTEALTLSDSIVVLERGEVQQIGAPEAVYHRPANLFVAGFVGTPRMNLLRGRIENGVFAAEGVRMEGAPTAAAGEIVLGIRPEDVEIAARGTIRGDESIPARIALVESLGSQTLLTLAPDAGGGVLRALVQAPPDVSEVEARLPAERRHWFDAATGGRLTVD